MAKVIGKPIMYYSNFEYKVNVPDLLIHLIMNESHQQKVKGLQITRELLEATANRALVLRDPILMDLFSRMGFIHTSLPVGNEGQENFGFKDI